MTPVDAFYTMFGISEEELRAEGIDPDVYAREHIYEAMNNDDVASKILGEPAMIKRRAQKLAGRVYVFLFAAIGLLFGTYAFRHGAGKAVFITAAALSVIAAIWCLVIQTRCMGAYYRAVLSEGGEPTDILGRKLFRWQIALLRRRSGSSQ